MYLFNKNLLCLHLLLIVSPLALTNHLPNNEDMFPKVMAHNYWHWLSIAYWIKVKIVIVTFFLSTWLFWGIRYIFSYAAEKCSITTMPVSNYGGEIPTKFTARTSSWATLTVLAEGMERATLASKSFMRILYSQPGCKPPGTTLPCNIKPREATKNCTPLALSSLEIITSTLNLPAGRKVHHTPDSAFVLTVVLNSDWVLLMATAYELFVTTTPQTSYPLDKSFIVSNCPLTSKPDTIKALLGNSVLPSLTTTMCLGFSKCHFGRVTSNSYSPGIIGSHFLYLYIYI
uniref:Uncharacterized protein n=1 Tax=Glossina brevipalpis TaxID=37001 RepID=A0A1A9WP48_9MUSC